MSTNLDIAPATRRKDVIGGSEVAAIVGADPNCSPFELAAIKKGLAEKKRTSYMTRGKLLERAVADIWADETMTPITWLDAPQVSQKADWAVASPDFNVTATQEGGEVKTVSPYMIDKWGAEHTDEIPDNYLLQVQWVMFVTGWKLVHVPAFVHRDDIRSYVVRRDDELIGTLYQQAEKFRRDYLLTDKMPPITKPGEIVDSYIRTRFPQHANPARPAQEAEIAGATELARLKAQIAALEDDKGRIEALLKSTIGEAEGIYWDGGRISWKNVKASEKVDWQAIAGKLGCTPELIAQYTKASGGYRRFVVSIKGGKEE